MNIFFDLDGTLIDARERLYRLFQQLVPTSSLSFDQYWEQKRNKISHKELLADMFNYTDDTIEAFQRDWMINIERPEWLALDKPFDGISDRLKELKKSCNLFVVTHRQFRESVSGQMTQFGWLDLFKDVFVTSQKTEKYDLIKNVADISPDDWFVGDTGNDIQTGKKLGVRTVAVLSGFLSREKLSEYSPDRIEDNVLKIKFSS